MTDILLIDADAERREKLARTLTDHGYTMSTSDTVPSGFDNASCACAICLDTLAGDRLASLCEQLPVIVTTENGSIPDAVAAIRRGAYDYLELPLETGHLIATVERASTTRALTGQGTLQQFPMIGSSEAMQALKQNIAKVAPTESTVLISGQSGTGKELVARAIHAGSRRSSAPLISINCATIPQNLVEAELFGLERYENDNVGQRGLVHAAEGGTLFIDEIAELPAAAQARLLQVVQGENRAVGSTSTHTVNVRVIAATHRDLAELVSSGHFREDLFYRLNVVSLDLPPLRTRKQDILEIADWLLAKTSSRLGKEGLSFSDEATQAMESYHWPGNVRELENAVERAVILSDNNVEITRALLAIEPSAEAPLPTDPAYDSEQTSLEDYFVRFVLDHQDQLTETELAEKLGISRKSLWERRQRLNIPRRKTRKRGPRRDTSTT